MSPLLTDLYQLTMAYGYWKLGLHERQAVFHQIFRRNPFGGNYTIAAGLASVIDFLSQWHFSEEELAYLAELRAPDGTALFSTAFLAYLAELRFTCDIDAIPEGTLVFPHMPLLRVTGPLLQAQLIESTLMNFINFQTLIATKASRVCQAAAGDPVLEFGLRRAQGPDGALSASRAAYLGGCSATSNVLAGMRFGIPVSGTQGHSWVTAFPDEKTAFAAFASVAPNNLVLLVDTYDTLQGVQQAIALVDAENKRDQASLNLRGIRLDSGDLAALSVRARAALDKAGLTKTEIIASNSLDEYAIAALKKQGAKISVWGVGTRLVTASDQSALDGVYKLSALCNEKNKWEYKIKLSEDRVKISNPGILQVRRYLQAGQPIADVIYDELSGIEHPLACVSLDGASMPLIEKNADDSLDLLQPIFREGQCVYAAINLHSVREKARINVKKFIEKNNQSSYPVGLSGRLQHIKEELITAFSGKKNERT